MKFRIALLFLLGILYSFSSQAQTPTWSSDIAPIVYDKCSRCHTIGGVGTFNLLSYQDAYARRYQMQTYINAGIMPPWPPDPEYQHYSMERALTDAQISLINDWVNMGAPRGDSTLEPPAPFYPENILGPGDLTLRMKSYTSQATTQDDYICVAMDPQLTSPRILQAMEVMPGNREAVHHVLVYAVDSGNYVPDSIYSGCTDPGGRLLGGYAPGGGPAQFPNGATKMGMTLQPGQLIVFAMHYPHGSLGERDSTSVNLHFYPNGTQGVREVSASPLFENWAFCIQPNEQKSIEMYYPSWSFLLQDYSILSVFPHNHLLGKSWEVYAFQGTDTIPLIKIPHWDFEWQGFYFFDYIKKIPYGYRLFAKSVYDNTTNNPHLQGPPQLTCAGLNTTDEMFLVYLHFLPYQQGDENIHLDSMMTLPVAVAPRNLEQGPEVRAFPNPFKQFTSLEYVVQRKGHVTVDIFDLKGKKLKSVWRGPQGKGTYRAIWHGEDQQGQPLPAGNYLARIQVGDQVTTSRLVKVD